MRKSIPLVLAILLVVLALYQVVMTFSSGRWQNPSEEMVSKWEKRLQPLLEVFPSGVSQVGYVDDAALISDPSLLDVNEFQLMQYSVAPVALQYGLEQEWIIGNFNEDENLADWLSEQLGTYELRSFGFGLYLIRNLEN